MGDCALLKWRNGSVSYTFFQKQRHKWTGKGRKVKEKLRECRLQMEKGKQRLTFQIMNYALYHFISKKI